MPDRLPDSQLNALLRQVDWRFLLHQPETPRALDLKPGRHSRALQLACGATQAGPASADIVVLGRPTRAALRDAREALRPGGEVVCLWRLPAPGGVGRARRRIERAGFVDARVYWPGPVPHRSPHFWLPLDAPEAIAHLLADRPAGSSFQSTLRLIWRAVARTGSLAPLCAIARAPGGADQGHLADPIDARLGGSASWMLLTGGRSALNKVVGLPFVAHGSAPPAVVKFARVQEAEQGLHRESNVLRALEVERPELGGIPRVLTRFHRVGRGAVAESAILGRPLVSQLTHENFGDHAMRLTKWLIELAGSESAQPAAQWWPRLAGEPLERLSQVFGRVLGRDSIARAQVLLGSLGDLPLAFEHRDFAPWNIILDKAGSPAVLDWESAEPRGLPLCDLVYFLTTAAFVLEKSIESGRTSETYERLHDPSSPSGRIAAACIEEYSSRLGLDRGTVRRLRLVCWIERCLSWSEPPEEIRPVEPNASMEAISLALVDWELRLAG